MKQFNLIAAVLLSLFLTNGCASSPKKPAPTWQFTQYKLKEGPVIGELPNGDDITLGGFSDLVYLGKSGDEYSFITITDRGPNADLIDKADPNDKRRTFLSPTYSPQIVFLETNSQDKTLKVVRQLPLKGPNGKLLTGLPIPNKDGNGTYELPITGKGEPITPDPLGIDTECVTVDPDGNFWVGEEYRPSILKFNKEGNLVRMIVPKNYFTKEQLAQIRKQHGTSSFIRQALPEEYRYRRVNRGYESCTVLDGKVYFSLQSALDRENENQQDTRWTVVDLKTEKLTELIYPLVDPKKSRISGLTYFNGVLYAIEQDSKVGPESLHSLYRVNLERTETGEKLTGTTLFLDFVAQGLHEFEKIEGAAFITEDEIAVVNDNDFGLTFEGKLGVDPNLAPTLTILKRLAP